MNARHPTEDEVGLLLKDASEAFAPGARDREEVRQALRCRLRSEDTPEHRPQPIWARLARWTAAGVKPRAFALRLVAAAAIVVLIVVLLSWRTPGGRGSGVAFADVMDRLEKVRTVSFTFTVRDEGQPAQADKIMEVVGRKARMEISTGDTAIIDCEARRMLLLAHPIKKAFLSDWPAGAQMGSSFMGSSLDELKQRLVPRGLEEEELGQGLVDGKRATGFRIQVANDVWTVWADAHTGLLLRVDWVMDTPTGRHEQTYSDFKFNEEFDDALFSLQPPAGYEVVSSPLSAPTADDLKKVCQVNLKQVGIAIFMYLQAHDHQYPNSLDDLVTYREGRQPLICPGSGAEGYIYDKPVTPFLKTAEPRSVMTVYDKPGNHEGGRNVLFLDWHVQWLTEEEFQKLWAEQEGHAGPKGPASARDGREEGAGEGR